MLLRIRVASCACAALVASPALVGAQQTLFVQGLAELTAAVQGTYGDEGVRIGPALDKMAGALAEWDRQIQTSEARLTSELPDAPPRLAFQMRLALGRTYVERGRFADALRELDAARRVESQHADLHVLRGLVLEASDRSTEAAAAFRTAWSMDASDPITAYYAFRHTAGISNTKDLQGAREALAAAYGRLLQAPARAKASPFIGIGLRQDSAGDTPVLPPVAYAQGYAHIARGEYDEAIAEFRKAAASDPLITDPAAQSASMMRAVAALRQGHLAEARSLLENLRGVGAPGLNSDALQDSSQAHRVLGLTYWTVFQYDKSVEQLEIAVRRNPRDERSHVALSRVLSSAGRDRDAERALQETIRVLPDSALAHFWLGWGYERVNRFADARRAYEFASAGAVAGRSRLYASVGRLAANAADFPGAIEAFAGSVSASPNDPTLHKYLADALLQQDRADEAFVELVAALLIDPLDAGAHAGIGQIHLNAGRYHDAVTALRRAVELSASDTEARYALASALMRLGNTHEAAQEFERVRQRQRQALAERRRNMALDVLREEAALRAAEGSHDRAAALWLQVIDREGGHASDHLGLAAALAGAGRIDRAIAQYEKAVALGADPVVYRTLAELYEKVGRIDDATRARAIYDRALQGSPTGKGTPP